ncbi:biotin-dependent carboxyltransferase family protein [Serinicoccus hydrothermalis]|uniref:5-oxoprolinase subunit C family protein n=1 Tax=Serinicoccus hydrothermalis TaxID=1758689 RepID=UPI00082CF4F7|nr:biotin-dependent carboxyltransferase family protein [Serinicoccus hydrothermalis]
MSSGAQAHGLEVLRAGPGATVQDLGRPGLAHLGVGRSGAADVPSLRLANRLLGNDEGAAALEVTVGGLAVRCTGGAFVALTGAPCPLTLDGRAAAPDTVLWLPDGAELELGMPTVGLRSYLAVRGGVDVEPVLGSRSRDTLAGLGPEPLTEGTQLPVGPAPDAEPVVDSAPLAPPTGGEISLRVRLGPREDWFAPGAEKALLGQAYQVSADSDRVGARLEGPALERADDDRELPSEGMVLGSLQVPPSGQPTIFLADHPVTGGYPVIGVLDPRDVPAAAQARPGQSVRFVRAPSAASGSG